MKSLYNWCRKFISIPFLVCAVFIVFMLFFNEHSMMKSFEYDARIEQQRSEIKQLTDSLNYYRRQNALLNSDPQTMEKVVREQHRMRRVNEDVYVFVD